MSDTLNKKLDLAGAGNKTPDDFPNSSIIPHGYKGQTLSLTKR
jgi:hypothetical protein